MNTITGNILKKYPSDGVENLIPLLQEIQNEEGFLSENSLIEVGRYLNIAASKIYGVATFYNQFRFQPQGKYNIQVCRGTACHVLGSASVLDELKKQLKIEVGQTTKDGLFSIEVVACIGACGLAPVICVNGNFHARITKESLKEIIGNYRKNA